MTTAVLLPSKTCQNCTKHHKTVHYSLWEICGNMYISFSKMPILFFIYLEKIANIRKYRKNDEY